MKSTKNKTADSERNKMIDIAMDMLKELKENDKAFIFFYEKNDRAFMFGHAQQPFALSAVSLLEADFPGVIFDCLGAHRKEMFPAISKEQDNEH